MRRSSKKALLAVIGLGCLDPIIMLGFIIAHGDPDTFNLAMTALIWLELGFTITGLSIAITECLFPEKVSWESDLRPEISITDTPSPLVRPPSPSALINTDEPTEQYADQPEDSSRISDLSTPPSRTKKISI